MRNEIQNMPQNWELKKLGDVCDEIFAGGDLPKNNYSLAYCDKYQIPIYANGEKNKGLYGYTNIPRVSTPSVTISARGTIGFAEVRNRPFFPIVRLIVLRPKNYLDPYYLKYAVDNCNIKHTGSSIPQLTVPTVKTLQIPLPPLPEQRAIVAKIEELLSDLENGKQQLQTAQEQLKIYRQSLLKAAFEGKLTNKNVKEGELPHGWKWVKIDSLLKDTKKGMATGPFGTMLKKSEHQKTGIPVIGIENIGEGVFQMPNKIFITSEKAVELKSFRVIENDIIISRSGTVGEICLLPKNMENSIISTNLIRVSLNQNIINPKFFVYLFQGGKVRQQVFELCKGSSRAFLNQTILKALDFPFCPLEEQQRIIDELESKLTICDNIATTISQTLAQTETLRQSILKKAFEGKLVRINEETKSTDTNNKTKRAREFA